MAWWGWYCEVGFAFAMTYYLWALLHARLAARCGIPAWWLLFQSVSLVWFWPFYLAEWYLNNGNWRG